MNLYPFLLLGIGAFIANPAAAEVLAIDAAAPPAAAQSENFHLGTVTAPGGHTLGVDSRGLIRDGRRWLPVMGEFHFSRYPQTEWRDELLKMKAGGVSIVASYIFWIHHEEVQGQWNWSAQRDLRKFLQTCQDVGLDVLLRIGPWCHGEVRNGGFPDWLQKLGDDKVIELRRDDPRYLDYVRILYGQIGMQTKGLLWKDGGPVIGVQLENEYSGPAQHLMTLKGLARDAGLDVPLYTRTGFGNAGGLPFGEILPFGGGYAEGFWDRSLAPMPGGYAAGFRFSAGQLRNAAAMGDLNAGGAAAAAAVKPAADTYPYFLCELGGGMMPSYHRRIFIYPQDVESMALVKLGSGANLLGFYMYHGGENPDGRLSDLNETQATNYWNDLPVKNYDFQAPLGEFGQEREHYHAIRLLALFLQDFGADLEGMTVRRSPARGGLNWAVRSDGTSGYIFASNYQRLAPQPARANVQFQIKLAGGEITLPAAPVTIGEDTRFIWPLNLDLDGVKLVYATAQPICRIEDGDTRYYVFEQTPGVPSEFAFDPATATVAAGSAAPRTENGRILLREVAPGLGAAIRLRGSDGRKLGIILLDQATALGLWKGPWLGRDRLFLTRAQLMLDGSSLRLSAEDPRSFDVGILPAPGHVRDGEADLAGAADGLFRRFSDTIAPLPPATAAVELVRAAGPARAVPIAPSIPARQKGMAMQPEDSDFAAAAVWRITLPAGIDPARTLRLRVRYTGDVARAYWGDKLLTDDFYDDRPFEIGLNRYGPQAFRDGILLKILPLREDAPIYLTRRSDLRFDGDHVALSLGGVDVIETRTVRLEGSE